MYEVRGGSGMVYRQGTMDDMIEFYGSEDAPKDDEPLIIARAGVELDPRIAEIFGWNNGSGA